jgi:transposase
VVRTWRGPFAARGIPGLSGKPRSGRPEVHGPSARLAVVAVATSLPPEAESGWSQAMIAAHLRGRGLAISAATVGRVLGEAKVRPHKVRREFGYVRHGTVPVLAAMNVTTGEVITERVTSNDSAAFISFLAMVHQMIPPHLRVHLIMDNGSSHTSRATRAWLAAHPRCEVTYTPKHASWLNMIEQWSGVLTRRLLRRGDFTSRDDLEARITAFTIQHNKNARPCKWSYDADAGHARYLERHRQPEPVPAPAHAA